MVIALRASVDPHARWYGERWGETGAYPIRHRRALLLWVSYELCPIAKIDGPHTPCFIPFVVKPLRRFLVFEHRGAIDLIDCLEMVHNVIPAM